MSDIIDNANALAEQLTSAYIEHARCCGSALAPCGKCHNCDEPLGAGLNFCDVDCRDDWQRRDAAARRNGPNHGHE